MTLGIEIGLGTGDIVLDGDPAAPHGKGHSSSPRKGAQQPPLLGPCPLWPNDRPSEQLQTLCCF